MPRLEVLLMSLPRCEFRNGETGLVCVSSASARVWIDS